MSFSSIEYLFLFIPTVFIVYFLLNKLKLYSWAKIFLLLASLFFYGAYKWEYVNIIIVSIFFNYCVSKVFKFNIEKSYKKPFLIFAIIGNLLMLFFFKYFNSLVEILNSYSHSYIDTFQIIFPIGISFYTLQQISYIVDCYNGKLKEYNLVDYALFICFFPQLIAGPIVRHQEIIPQFNNPKNRIINQKNIFIGIFLITVGLLKKTVFADEFASFIDYIVSNEIYTDFYISWLLSITKTLQVYFDFSGYCDIALGSASLFNISLPWNFNSPFQSKNISEFWKKYNMTLIRFLKDYVYKPLGGNKNGNLKTFRNILIMFTLSGIWMGVNIVNVLYGLLHGIYICINKLWNKINVKMPNYIAVFITFLSILFTAPFLFEKNIENAFTIIKSMLSIDATYTHFVIEKGSIYFMLTPPHKAQINLYIFFLAFIIIFFFKNSSKLAILYSKKNNLFYTFILAIIFMYAVLCITKTTSFIYFVF